MKHEERRRERGGPASGRVLLRTGVALAALVVLPGCGEAEAPETVEALGATSQGLTCVNLRRAPGSPSVQDAHIVVDPIDPTRASANYGAATVLNAGAVGTGQRSALLKFDLSSIPAAATITSATLQLAKAQSIGVGPVNVHRVTGSWSESSVTYASFAGAYDSGVLASFDPSTASTAISVDVTGVVGGWHAGSYANEGVLLAEPTNGRVTLGSSESTFAQRPVLNVCYAPASCADGVQNGAETGVDCGGPCAPCVDPCANVVCAPLDACHVAGSCNPSTGQCTNPNAAWGTPCDDGDACTQSDTCQSGTCVGASPVSCPAGDACHAAGVCDPQTGACSNAAYADGTPCDDGNACTSNDVCSTGTCAGSGSCGPTGFDVLDTAGVVYNGTNYTVLKVAFAGADSTGPTWCDDYTDLCAAYGGTPTGCGQPFVGMSGTGYEACSTQWDSSGGNENLGCNPSWQVSQAAQAAGFGDATDTNSFGYHWCDAGTCQKTMCTGDYCNTALSYVDLSKAHGYTLCAVAPSCVDGQQNQGETGVDCGGPCGACVAMCGDGIQNSDEDGVDCGGSFCAACPSGFNILASVPITMNGNSYTVLKVALQSNDATGATWCDDYGSLCASIGGAPTGCGLPYTAMAGTGYETCVTQYGSVGGADNLGCNPSGSISQAAQIAGFGDATSDNSFGFHWCDAGTCTKTMCNGSYCNTALSYMDASKAWGYTVCSVAPSCIDGAQNQGETGLDCGGPCGACVALCSDGIQNSDEDGVDCGGSFCGACPSGFNVLASANVTHNGVPHLVLKVGMASQYSSGASWCDDYTSLCQAYGMLPTGCGLPFSDMSGTGYEACESQWSSAGQSDALNCNPSASIAQMAQSAGFADAVDTNSFAYHWCDSGTCSNVMCAGDYCNTALSYIDANDAFGYTACVAAPTCTDGIMNGSEAGVDCGGSCATACPQGFQVLGTQSVNYGGSNYLVVKVSVASSQAAGATWCDDYRDLCQSFGRAPTGCGQPYAGQSDGYGACVTQYSSVGATDSLGCNPSGTISAIAQTAGYADASSDNSFGFHYCDSGTCTKTLCSGSYCSAALSYIDVSKSHGYTVCK